MPPSSPLLAIQLDNIFNAVVDGNSMEVEASSNMQVAAALSAAADSDRPQMRQTTINNHDQCLSLCVLSKPICAQFKSFDASAKKCVGKHCTWLYSVADVAQKGKSVFEVEKNARMSWDSRAESSLLLMN